MARRFAKRDQNGEITGSVTWPSANYPEEIDDSHPDYVAYIQGIDAPRGPEDIPLNAEELYDILATKGILLPQDRPRPKKVK